MTTDSTGASPPAHLSKDSADGGGVKEQTQQAANTAADEGKRVADVASGEVSNVAGEAKAQAQQLMQQAGDELEAHSRQQMDRLVDTMRTLGDDLDKMASQGGGVAAQVANEAAQRARSLSRHLDQREPRDLLEDVRSFARRRPGTFLLGALAAGVVTGRLARGAKDGSSGDGGSTSVSSRSGPAEPTATPYGEPGIGGQRVTTEEPLADPLLDPYEPGRTL